MINYLKTLLEPLSAWEIALLVILYIALLSLLICSIVGLSSSKYDI